MWLLNNIRDKFGAIGVMALYLVLLLSVIIPFTYIDLPLWATILLILCILFLKNIGAIIQLFVAISGLIYSFNYPITWKSILLYFFVFLAIMSNINWLSYAIKSIIKAFSNFSFKGRISRKDFWVFTATYTVILIILAFIDVYFGICTYTKYNKIYWLQTIFYIVMLIPRLSIQVKRLHDIEKDWYLVFFNLLPGIGDLILLFLFCKKGDAFENKYGDPPYSINSI